MKYRLLKDITAVDLAMVSPDGYHADHVIGHLGTEVSGTGSCYLDMVEVAGFDSDPFAYGFVSASDLTQGLK